MRNYGRCWFDKSSWHIVGEPHIIMRAKRVFERIDKTSRGGIELSYSPEVCHELLWFMARYPLEISELDSGRLKAGSQLYTERIDRLEEILDPDYKPSKIDLAIPLREYQRRAVELYLSQGSLLLGDDVGIGKTATAIGSFSDPSVLPAVVVTMTHLPKQWQREISRFAPDLHTHVVKKGTAYELPQWFGKSPDVVIMNYAKLGYANWSELLAKYAKSVIFDECQELRRSGSGRYTAAQFLARACKFRLGLSATPVYNYGAEYWNVSEILSPGTLGTFTEFLREWCKRYNKGIIADPRSFGSYLRERGMMLRRTRKQVGRELPKLTKIIHPVEADAQVLMEMKDSATELARVVMRQTQASREARFVAAGQFDMVMRQQTGLAKAPYVCEFVKMILEGEDRVMLYGWHREVYDVWRAKLAEFNPVMYTGTESSREKEMAFLKFTSQGAGASRVMIISLRSGAGLDGLQKVCRTVVFGEFDWSPGVHEQCVGRVFRDGQADPVVAYFLAAEDGADPFMLETLGIKRDQADGIRSPEGEIATRVESGRKQIREMAKAYLQRLGQKVTKADEEEDEDDDDDEVRPVPAPEQQMALGF